MRVVEFFRHVASRLLPLPCVANPPPTFEVAPIVCPRAPFAAPAAGGARAGLRNTGKIQNLPASHTKEAKKNLVKLNRKPTDQSVSGFNLTRFWGSIFGDAAWVLQAFSMCAPISATLPGCYWHSLCLPPCLPPMFFLISQKVNVLWCMSTEVGKSIVTRPLASQWQIHRGRG